MLLQTASRRADCSREHQEFTTSRYRQRILRTNVYEKPLLEFVAVTWLPAVILFSTLHELCLGYFDPIQIIIFIIKMKLFFG